MTKFPSFLAEYIISFVFSEISWPLSDTMLNVGHPSHGGWLRTPTCIQALFANRNTEIQPSLNMKLWCYTVAKWNTLSWKQQSGTHKSVHLGFFFLFYSRVTSCFAGGAIFNGRYIRCDSCAQHNVLFSPLFFAFLLPPALRAHVACNSLEGRFTRRHG